MNKTQEQEKLVVPDHLKPDLNLFKSLVMSCSDTATSIEKRAIISNTLYDKLSTVSNPYQYVLDLVYYSSEVLTHDTYGEFNIKVLTLFQEWLSTNVTDNFLNFGFKKTAAEKLVQMKSSIATPCIGTIQLMYKIFGLDEQGDMLKNVIDNFLTSGSYVKVCPVIIALELQPFYTLDQVAIPLIFNDRRPMVELYLESYPELQLELVKILDNIHSSPHTIQNFVTQKNIHLHPSINKDKLSTQHIRKILGKLLKTFNISIEQCPNLLRDRGFAALNYLMKKRFKEKAMTHDAWKEMVELTVHENSELQRQLLISLIRQNEFNLAVEIAHSLGIDERIWPQGLLEFSKSPNYRPFSLFPPDNYVKKYLPLDIHLSQIHFIDTLEKFLDSLNVMEVYPVLGFDAEWRPSFGFDVPSELALLQLAVSNHVFLFDHLSLRECLNSSHWRSFTERIFCNPHILKLGFATRDDMNVLKHTCLITDKQKPFSQVVDLNPLIKMIFNHNPEISMYLPTVTKPIIQGLSLSEACHMLLGKPLNKSEQLSNWEKRPLREAQIIYASLDAFCLIQIFEKLQTILKEWNLDIMNFVNQLKTNQPMDNLKLKLFQSMNEDRKINYSRLPLPFSQFKIILDSALENLKERFVQLGAEVQLLNQDLSPEDINKLANIENWHLVASGKCFVKIAVHWPRGTCYCVNMTLSVQEKLNAVCDYFNIYVPEKGNVNFGANQKKKYSPKVKPFNHQNTAQKVSSNESPKKTPFNNQNLICAGSSQSKQHSPKQSSSRHNAMQKMSNMESDRMLFNPLNQVADQRSSQEKYQPRLPSFKRSQCSTMNPSSSEL